MASTKNRARRTVSAQERRSDRLPPTFPVYSADELAALLGVSKQTLRLWRQRKRGPRFIRETPRTCVYLKSTVHDWLKAHEVRGQRKQTRRRQTRADKATVVPISAARRRSSHNHKLTP
jgi:hypothetical protein